MGQVIDLKSLYLPFAGSLTSPSYAVITRSASTPAMEQVYSISTVSNHCRASAESLGE